MADALEADWLREETEPVVGSEWERLRGRLIADQPPWSYPDRAAALLQASRRVLDLNTGGGERLLELRPHWPPQVVAVESHPPNLRLAHDRLAPLGVHLINHPADNRAELPFASGAFDVVLVRHAPFNAREVERVLRPGGAFLTQQVHGRAFEDLMALFGATPQWPGSTLDKYQSRLMAAGMTIVHSADWTGKHRFTDVGALVYQLRAVPWLVPGFTVTAHLPRLRQLHQRCQQGHPLAFAFRTFLIEARKPPAPGDGAR